MWSSVQTVGSAPATGCYDQPWLGSNGTSIVGLKNSTPCSGGSSPTSRLKHAMCAAADGHIYLMGGRSCNRPLRDLWRFDAGQNQWDEVQCKGQLPPVLQEHTMVAWNGRLYVFGGEIANSPNSETPLWVLDLATLIWTKKSAGHQNLPPGSSGTAPSGRRGHTAVIYGDALHIYGGFEDLRGSLGELWTFDLVNEQWHLMSCAGRGAQPSKRHGHSAVVHGSCMYIYGGQTDLQEKSDLWKWDFISRNWTRIKSKSKKRPEGLYGHTAVNSLDGMILFGGERKGALQNDLWKFNFDSETWERLATQGMTPNARCRHTAVANPFLNANTCNTKKENPLTAQDINAELTSSEQRTSSASPTDSEALVSTCELPPASGNKDTDKLLLTSVEWPASEAAATANALKRHTVHESMSYYSLCFPSPTGAQQAGLISASEGASPSTPSSEQVVGSNPSIPSIARASSSNNQPASAGNSQSKASNETTHIPQNSIPRSRFSSISMYEGPVLSSLADFEEEDGYEEDELLLGIGNDRTVSDIPSMSEARSVNYRMFQAPQRREMGLVELGTEADRLAELPTGLPRPKSSYMFPSLFTPSIESRGLPHSMSHSSSGYQSLVDESLVSNESVSNPFGNNVLAAKHPGVVFRQKKGQNRNHFELKNLNQRMSLQESSLHNGNEESHPASIVKALTSRTKPFNRVHPISNNNSRNENAKPNWQPQINAIKEVVVPASPANRKWITQSPMKRGKPSMYDWQLAMLVFGGKEKGISTISKQPISVWKLYI